MSQVTRVSLVTGASGSIGRAVAERLAAAGIAVGVHYAGNSAAAQAVVAAVERGGRRAVAVRGDVADEAAMGEAFQAGSREIVLDDATRLAARAAAHDVAVALQVTPDVPHVFQGIADILEEGATALSAAGAFLRVHLPTPLKKRLRAGCAIGQTCRPPPGDHPGRHGFWPQARLALERDDLHPGRGRSADEAVGRDRRGSRRPVLLVL
ncbi:SDR family NAD(P)-dependent oxidoreductase [Streptomyces gibsoniae]|uniref:SDR family NAD(P)-dependent oxidoreductase n=1 Tax=Streptomyces gibsoniae TaxID=3075529 RepID=A0ABU2U7R9_9ACTN|nr:SDR family NAD(P)-dependent oxidoreductase [Streptomyces sp. DSM 41699]MDT0469259.1 SDR family NAD(P)-dependent oxidoreductase [Streptomyces sp. DSM 41699]